MNPAVFLKNCGVQPRPAWPWLRVVGGPLDGRLVTLRGSLLNGTFAVTGELVYPWDRQAVPT